MRRLLTFLLLILISGKSILAQDTLQLKYFDIDQIKLSQSLDTNNYAFAYSDSHAPLKDVYSQLAFQKGAIHKLRIPDRYVTKKAVIRFNIRNNADTSVTTTFYPGYYYDQIDLYKLEDGNLIPIKPVLPENTTETSYRYLQLLPHDSATIVAHLGFVRTYLNRITPRLISPAFLQSYVNNQYTNNKDVKIFTYLFCGLLLMMIMYSLSNFIQEGTPEFLYYSGYAFFVGLMLLIKAIYSWQTSRINFLQEAYLDYVLLCIGHLFYMLFMQKYLAVKANHPFLQKLYVFGITLLAVSISIFTYTHYFTDNYVFETNTENYTKIVLLVMVFLFLVYSIRHWDDKLLRYAFWGNLSLFIFSLISQLIIMGKAMPKSVPPILQSSLAYYEIGLFLELLFFLAGLNYKNRKQLVESARERERLRAANLMNEYEKEIAVYKAQQTERERISADMHDELGSGMTAIRLMSEIARNKMKESTPVEIEKISHSADEVLNKMNAIIWSMNSGNDTVDNLVSYIRSFALEFFEYTPITCRIFTPDQIEPKELTGEKRRNLFLCVKESLNNVLKHSKATEVKLSFRIDTAITIRISDNGVGIDMQKIRQFGNGLKNISKRMESIGGTYQIENQQGTVTTLHLPLQ